MMMTTTTRRRGKKMMTRMKMKMKMQRVTTRKRMVFRQERLEANFDFDR